MNKELRERSAYRTIVAQTPDGDEFDLTVRVSGQHVEFHRQMEMPWDNADGTGNDIDVTVWSMGLDSLKRLIEQAQICIRQSEAFEKAHPVQASEE